MEGSYHNYTYIGCFEDRFEILLPAGPYTTTNNEMSTNICFNHCNSKSYKNFATEFGTECYCGHLGKVGSGQYPRKKETDCNKTCKGHVTIKCGGKWKASVYRININGNQLSTTKHTPTSPNQSQSVIAEFSIYTVVIVPVLVLLFMAALVFTLVLCFRRNRGKDLHLCEILQYQNITERTNLPSYTTINYNEMTDIIIPEMNESRHRNNATQCEPKNISASIQQEENSCNNYESLSNNRKSVEHIYQSESIHNNQLSLDEHINKSTEEAMKASVGPNLVQYQSLTYPLESNNHVYASTVLYSNAL